MRKFVIYWYAGFPRELKGDSLADACRRAGIEGTLLYNFDYYVVDGKVFRVGGQATCKCAYSLEYGYTCKHDLELVGF